jgi:hypothetical protein
VPVLVSPTDARTLGDLKTRIADELARADLASQIALAITDAISEAATHRFWFMEVRGYTLPLTAGTSHYTSDDIEGLIEIDRLKLISSGQTWTLRVMNDDELDRLNDGNPPSGQPYAYSRYGEYLTFYPSPQASYSVTIDGVSRGTALVNDTDSNIWTTTGEKYIRALAKRSVLADVIHDDQAAQTQDALAARYREEFWQQTHSRTATGEMACNA